ncbi:MAG: UTP--glucose-1-phosphate uridylyltransferase GalU [Actinomycetota bacterium]
MKAIIPAAGFGTRLLPATKAQPKEMLPVVDKPIIQYVIEEAVASGIEDILVITGRGKRAIEDHFDKSFELEYFLREEEKHDFLTHVQGIADLADIHYIRQKELRGLGHAVLCARKHLGNEPFAVLLGDTITLMDIPCTRTLLDIFKECGSPIIAVEEVSRDKVKRYGIIDGYPIGGGIYRVENLIEKPSLEEAPSNLAIFGRYILTPEIFDCLERTPPGRNNEIQLTDALRLLLAEQNIYAYKVEGKRYDIGSKIDWLKANIEIALARNDLREDLTDYLKMLHS